MILGRQIISTWPEPVLVLNLSWMKLHKSLYLQIIAQILLYKAWWLLPKSNFWLADGGSLCRSSNRFPHGIIFLWPEGLPLISFFDISSLPGFPWGSDCKEFACNAGDPCSIPALGRSPGEGNGNPVQYSCLENPMDRGTWQAIVHGVTNSQTRLSD